MPIGRAMLRLTDELGPWGRRLVWAGFALLAGIVAVAAAHSAFGLGGAAVENPIRDFASSVVYAVVAAIVALRAWKLPDQRRAWTIVAVGVTFYALGNLVWVTWLQPLQTPPIPSLADPLWLALYPCSYVGLVMLGRIRGRPLPAGAWLDGIIAGLGISALGAATIFGPVLESTDGDPVAVATSLAYPIGDLLLVALVVGVLALRGWVLDRAWALLGAGFLALAFADLIYLLHVADGSHESSLWANVFYMSGVSLLAAAAWASSRQPRMTQLAGGWSVALPAAFVGLAMALTAVDHWVRLDPLGYSLATLTMIAAALRVALAFRDLRALAETRRLALTDELTSLANRRLLMRDLTDELAAARYSGAPVALLVLDLDHFKELNDTLGHATGDTLLREVGARLDRALDRAETLARLGGDEFGVLVAAADEDGAVLTATRLHRALEEPFTVGALQLRVTASIGIAVHPEHGTTADELLQRADIAMYQAKRLRSGHAVYAADLDRHSRTALELIGELPGALVRGELEAHFQVKADTRSGQVVAAEALVRWRHPTRGLLSPAEFVDAAEHAGLGRDLTRVVLGQALLHCRRWLDAGHDIAVAVNTTVADLLDTSLPAEVGMALHHAGVPAGRLILEVTETSVLADPVRIGAVLGQLRDLGIDISLDDFGTGYSSLSHLRTLPVDEVKIDRSFVKEMLTDPVAAAIVRSTVQLAAALGIASVAEGIEDDATWAALAEIGCDLVQGYHLSRPLPAAAVDALLDAPLLVPAA